MPPFTAARPKLEPLRKLQPETYENFACVADACTDTCCDGWQVTIDRSTYHKYQRSSDPVLGRKLQDLVQISSASTGDHNYATIKLNGSRCPFLSAEKLCSIQTRLGEKNLSNTCATYPRIVNIVDDVMERSLDLSCPEAARLALTNPEPVQFCLIEPEETSPGQKNGADDPPRLGSVSVLDKSNTDRPDKPHKHTQEIRAFAFSILQNRKYRIGERLVLLGHVCGKLGELAQDGDDDAIPGVLRGFELAINTGMFDTQLKNMTVDTGLQFRTALELMVARINLDYVPENYLDLYREFLRGIQFNAETSLEDLGTRYAEAYARYYSPFMAKHEYMLEHYLVHYAFKTLFPFGSQTVNETLNLKVIPQSIAVQYMLLATYYGLIKALLIGQAALHQSGFSSQHVIRSIQLCSRNLEHCVTYPARILEILATKGIDNPAGMFVLTQN